MTLKIEYTHICDTCCEHFEKQVYVVKAGMAIPRADDQYVINGHTLCPACTEIAVPALNEALKNRIKTEP